MKTFVREFIQCRTFLRVLYRVRNARSAFFIPECAFYIQSVMLSPRFIPESVFYTQSVVRIVRNPYLMWALKDKELSMVRPSNYISCTTSKGGLVRSANNS